MSSERTNILTRLKKARKLSAVDRIRLHMAANETNTMRFGPEIVHVGGGDADR